MILKKNRKSAKTGKSGHCWDTLAAARPRCQNGTPRVRRGIAKLRRGVAIVRSEKFFGVLFPNTSYSYTDSLRTLIND